MTHLAISITSHYVTSTFSLSVSHNKCTGNINLQFETLNQLDGYLR